jgi:hypothetical protein
VPSKRLQPQCVLEELQGGSADVFIENSWAVDKRVVANCSPDLEDRRRAAHLHRQQASHP